MKLYDVEIAPNNKKRTLLALGEEEIDLLYGMAIAAVRHMPQSDKNKDDVQRIKNMIKVFSLYTGRAKEKAPKSSDFPCPKCSRKLRGEKAIEAHIKAVHSNE